MVSNGRYPPQNEPSSVATTDRRRIDHQHRGRPAGRPSHAAPPVKSWVNPLRVAILSDVPSGPGGTVATERVQRRAHPISDLGTGVAAGPVTRIPRSGMRRSRRRGSIFVPVPPRGGLPKSTPITQPPVSSTVPSDDLGKGGLYTQLQSLSFCQREFNGSDQFPPLIRSNCSGSLQAGGASIVILLDNRCCMSHRFVDQDG